MAGAPIKGDLSLKYVAPEMREWATGGAIGDQIGRGLWEEGRAAAFF